MSTIYMAEEKPPPLPPKRYKLRKHTPTTTVNHFNVEPSLLEHSETADPHIMVNGKNGNGIFDEFVNLNLTRSSYFIKHDSTEILKNGSHKKVNITNNHFNDSLTETIHFNLQSETKDNGVESISTSLSTKNNDCFYKTSSLNIKNSNKCLHDSAANNYIDALISKNLEEFEVKVEKEKTIPEVKEPMMSQSENIMKPKQTLCMMSQSENIIKPKQTICNQQSIDTICDQQQLQINDEIDASEKTCSDKYNTSPLVFEKSPLPQPKSHSLPVCVESKEINKDKTKYEIFGSLFDTVIETNDDIIDFGKAVIELRKSFKHNDTSTNTGIISSHIVNNILPNTTVDVSIFFESDDERIMTCEYSWTASKITSHCLATFSNSRNSMDLFLLSNQYIFKIIGFDLYLEDSIRLCDHTHIQEYAKQGKTIKLDLINKNRMSRSLARDYKDDLMLDTCSINFGDFFEKPGSISVSEQGLSVLLESYDAEMMKLIDDATNTLELDFMPDRMIQVVKAISTVLATIDIPQIQNAIQLIQSLRSHGNQDNNTNHGYNESFQYEMVPSPVHKFDKELFDLALQQLTHGIYYFVELYCKSFELKFNLEAKKMLPKSYTDDVYQQVDKTNNDDIFERVDPRTISDKFVVKIESIHRIPSEWKFNFIDFQLEVGLYYGGELLCPVQKCTKSTVDKGFFEHISFAKLIEFDISVRQIPRETKIGFVLCGVISLMNFTPLCWFTSNLYNYEGFLISGSHLFGLLYDVDFDPIATCATNYIHHCDTVILKVDFQIYPIEVMFPQPMLFLSTETVRENELHDSDLEHIHKILKKDVMYLNEKEKSFIWNNRFSLSKYPKALIYVLLSVPSWDAESVLLVHNTLNYWKQLSPHNGLKLLEGNFPDKIIREHAIACINGVPDNELFDYLPGLVQALKYEAYHNSALARFLIKRSLCSVTLCHYLYWYLKYYVEDIQFCQRYKTLLSGLLHVCGRRLRVEFSKQDNLICALSKIANLVKETKDSMRKSVLRLELEKLNNELDSCFHIPYDPAIKVCKVIPSQSSYFSSNTVPLKIAFKNEDELGEDVNVIFKVGDDLRKDLLTLQMFHIMNSLWLNNGLDLKIMLYNVLPTGPYAGLIEIVPNASTLREIHIQYGGVTGSFKDDSVALWLQQFNSTKEMYEIAIDNFTASAAGSCVATYILGIGDRHNDNIMITKNGHLFHIDFNKYMGDFQKFGSIKRDRVPFVLTPDMAYVINNGVTPSHNFQKFTEYCCVAFNIIRRNRSKLLNILRLMMYGDIAYVSPHADIEYVYHALQLQLSDEEAEIYFSQLIQNSLSSMSTQLNFFIHNVAHMKDSIDNDVRKVRSTTGFSFSNQVHSFDCKNGVLSARVVDFQKRYVPGKHYVFVINIIQDDRSSPKFVFRRYDDFQELHTHISDTFGVYNGIELPQLPPKIVIGRSQIHEVAQERRLSLDKYLVDLSKIPKIWSSEIMATFLYSYIRDHEEEKRFFESIDYLQDGWKSRIGGKIKVSIVYEKQFLKIFITHVSNLVPRRIQGLADSYVKLYLLPDFMKHTKRKSKVCRKSLNPTFNETFTYNIPLELLKNRILQISVWDQINITDKEFLGGFNYYLSQFDPKSTTSCWFTLVDIDMNT